MNWTCVEPLDYFASLVSVRGPAPVLEAAASLAQIESPDLDVQAVLLEVDLLICRLQSRVPADASPTHRLKLLHHLFFEELSFGGNANDFYAAANGLVSEVLKTRRGIPASLGLIYAELARAIGLPAVGVAFPGHFLVRVRLSPGVVFMDPLTGRTVDRAVLEEWVMPYLDASIDPSDGAGDPEGSSAVPLSEAMWQRLLAPVSDRDLLIHLVRHLEAAYRMADDRERRERVLRRLWLLQEGGGQAISGWADDPEGFHRSESLRLRRGIS